MFHDCARLGLRLALHTCCGQSCLKEDDLGYAASGDREQGRQAYWMIKLLACAVVVVIGKAQQGGCVFDRQMNS